MNRVALIVAAGMFWTGCLCDDSFLDENDPPAFLRFDPPDDCDAALFSRTFAQCPVRSAEVTFPKIWDALEPSLTRETARSFIDERHAAIDVCCADQPSVVEIDVVIACDGSVADSRVRAPWFVGGCIDDIVRSWTFPKPAPAEQGFHLLLPCGPGA